MSTDVFLKLGRFELVFPPDHLLAQYQSHFRLYDWALGEIARVVAEKYPGACAIDIGANVGDSAAAICRHQDMPVLCIEGHPTIFSYLRRNRDRLPRGVEIVHTLVGASRGEIPSADLVIGGGTAKLQAASGPATPETIRMQPLHEILAGHPAFRRAKLLKSDTDGSDFEILLSSLGVLRKAMPALFFEFDPTLRKDGVRAGLRTIAALAELGYEHFLVYDNFGNFLETVQGDPVERFADLSRYVASHMFFGRQIYYIDVCCFCSADQDLAIGLHQFHADFVDREIRERGWEL